MRTTKLMGYRFSLTVVIFAVLTCSAFAQHQVVLLWPNGAPGSEGKTGEEKVRIYASGEHIFSNIHRPSITIYLPAKDKASGAGVVVIPGGGHREIWMDH